MNNTTINRTHITKHQEELQSDPFRLAFAIILLFIFFISICGGIFVCYVLKKNNLIKKKCWLYCMLLALSDISASLFTIPILVFASIKEHILQIQWICNCSGSIAIFFGTWQIYAIAAISMHRYITIMKPLQSLADKSYSGVIIYLLTSFVLSSFFAVGPILGFGGWTYMPGRQWCVLRSQNLQYDKLYSIIAAVFVYVVPLSIIIISALRIYIVVKNRKEITGGRRFSKADSLAEQNRVAHTLSLLIGTFFAFWTPSLIYFVAGGILRIVIPLWYSHIVYICMFVQNCINPVIYCFRHDTFRDELKRIMRRMRIPRKPRACSTSSDIPMRTPSSSLTLESETVSKIDDIKIHLSVASISTITLNSLSHGEDE